MEDVKQPLFLPFNAHPHQPAGYHIDRTALGWRRNDDIEPQITERLHARLKDGEIVPNPFGDALFRIKDIRACKKYSDGFFLVEICYVKQRTFHGA